MIKNDLFAKCLDCILTTHKMHHMIKFQANISRITLFDILEEMIMIFCVVFLFREICDKINALDRMRNLWGVEL